MKRRKIPHKNARKSRVIKYELLENGLDFILSGLTHLGKSAHSKRDYKFGILHLAAGIELVLKERLRREHWSLLFADVDCANENALASGDLKSVESKALMARLKGVAKIVIKPHEAFAVDELRKRRNKIQHLHISESQESIESIAARSVGFILDFIEAELPAKTLSEEEINAFEEIKKLLKEFSAFVEKRLDHIKPSLEKAIKSGGVVLGCVKCLQESLVLDDGSVRCLFCNSTFDPDTFAEEWASAFLGRSGYDHIKNYGPAPTRECPNCGCDSLVEVEEGKKWACFSCSECWASKDLNECLRCGNLFVVEGEQSVCDDCFREQVGNPNS